MNYYNKYSTIPEYNNYISGILTKKDDIFYVNKIEIKNNRALINDIVYIDENNEVINIKERCNKIIPGILCLQSKMKYGIKNNKQIYLFKPTNKQYPNFYVCSTSKSNMNVYAIIEFKSWEINEKQPFGNIIEILGPIGNKDNDLKALLYHYDLFRKQQKYDLKLLQEHKNIIEQLDSKKLDYSIFCIDPEGSKDLDDGFHYKLYEDYEEVGIHISYPYKFLNFDSYINELFQRVSTIYINPNIDLISSKYANDLCSFLKNNFRFSISFILKIKNNEIIDEQIKETIVYVEYNYHYEQFNELLKKNTTNSILLNKFMNLTKSFFHLDYIDSHILVEQWMIYTNKKMALILINNNNITNIILRVHQSNQKFETKQELKIKLDEKQDLDESYINYLNYIDEQSASYQIYNNTQEQVHSKMNNSFYTHFTSPMRRCVDFFNQCLFIRKKDMYSKEDLTQKIDFVNYYEKNLKKFYRKKNRLDFIYLHKNNEPILTYGYISKIHENYIRIFIPKYKLDEKILLFHYKLEKTIYIKKEELYIEYTYENKLFYYYIHQKINIKIFILSQEENLFDKIKIEVV